MPEKRSSMDERRAVPRELTCIPAHVELPEEGAAHLALIHDLSVQGALLYTRHQLEVGETVELSLFLSADDSPSRPAAGKVVRCSRRPIDRADVWLWEVGVVFSAAITEYESEIRELCERQRKIGLLK